MALARVKVWGSETLTASDLNGEINNILNNALSLISPLTGALDCDGFALTLDAAAVTTVQSTAAIAWTFTPGAKTGTPGTTGAIQNWAASTYTDNNTAGSGTAASFVAHAIQRPTLAATNANVTTTNAATWYIANAPAAGTNENITNAWAIWVDDGNVRFDGNLEVDGTVDFDGALDVAGQLRGTAAMGYHIQGLTYSNNSGDATNDIDIAIGMATSNDAAQANRRTMTLATAITKQSDVNWVVGTNQGGLDTGAVGNSDYYIWLIMRSDTGVVDVLFSLSSTAPTMPTSYDYRRLIGWFKRVGGTIVAFDTYETSGGGLELLWDSPTLDINLANTLTTSRRTDAVKVPLNFTTVALLNVVGTDTGGVILWVYCPDQADQAPSLTVAPLCTLVTNAAGDAIANISVRTSAAGLIAARANTATFNLYAVSTLGFRWARRN